MAQRSILLSPEAPPVEIRDPLAYLYVLGLYLGDGHLTAMARCHRLRISLDARYPGIIAEASSAVQEILPIRPSLMYRGNCAIVYCYSQRWPDLLPQHGEGMKHLRSIRLQEWQEQLVKKDPRPLVRGLIHSDGSRYMNVVKGGRYAYPTYEFSNSSPDIIDIFRRACEGAGVETRFNRRVSGDKMSIVISRRDAVSVLDGFVGPKY